ncbi:MAG: DNA methyltransferase [Coriobacteriia bacterium]|nr:DNA methyltransferase [Coriobacteriia bacterium]
MDKETRNRIQRATQDARSLLEREYASQLEGVFDIRGDGTIEDEPGSHLSAEQRLQRLKLVAAVAHLAASGRMPAEAVASYVRDSAFTALNRFAALKMLESRGLVLECVSKGDESAGFKEFTGLAPGLASLPDKGYQLYVESLFDEIGQEVRILFDRTDAHSLLWPRRQALLDLLGTLNDVELESVWAEDETIGWIYQFFNSTDERRAMRDASQAPRNSRELAVRNQFFTPRYVVQFLAENTLVRVWTSMYDQSGLAEGCEYYVRDAEQSAPRTMKDPRDIRVLDPACGSGHFLLYSFDLLLRIYEEAWTDSLSATSTETGSTLRSDYADLDDLKRALPALIVERNLYGVDIDARAAQIAALALWMRAQRAYNDFGVTRSQRAPVRRTHIVIAEPMPGDERLVEDFASQMQPPLLGGLFKRLVTEMRLAGDLGVLLRIDSAISDAVSAARRVFVRQQRETPHLPGMEPTPAQGELDLSGIDDDSFFEHAESRILEALVQFSESASGASGVRRRMFAEDSAQGIALIELIRTRFDVVLMNPPFGACSIPAKQVFEKSYPRTKNDLYAAFVERGIELLESKGMLGAITSRTGFFLSSFQKWREEILLEEAPPTVFADLGYGVLDTAMVEVAAYCLERSA